MAIADATAKNNQANIGTKKTEIKLDNIGDETKNTSSWLAKIFGLQEDEITRQKERDREADRAARNAGTGTGAGADAKKVSALGRMMKVALAPLLLTVKAISVMFGKIGKFVLVMKKFTKILLKPLLFTFAALSGSVAGVIALWAGLALIVGAFAGITIASMTMSDEDFDKLKMDIADGVAGAIRSTVKFAMDTWNDYTPDSWNIDPKTQKSFEDATFKGVSDTIVSIMDFINDLGDAFGEGFGTQMESFKQSWKDFKEVFTRIFDLFSTKDMDVDIDIKGGVLAGAKVIGAAIGFISEFFLDLATALGSTLILKEEAKTDNVLINAVANILGKIINFVHELFDAFGKGFTSKFDKISESMEGTKESFSRFSDFIGDLWDKAKEILGTIGGGEATGPSKGLLAAFTRFGALVGDMVASIFDIITIIMDFIVNPEEISGRARANVVNLFEDIGDAITDVFGSLFSTESIMSMLQAVLPETMFKGLEYAFGSLEEIAEQSILDKGTEIQSLQDENKAIAEDVALSKKLLAEELAKKEEDRSKEVIENLSYDIQVNERRIERNIEGAKALEEDIENSKKTRDKQRLARMIEEEMGESAVAQLKAVENLKDKIEDSADTFTTGFGAFGIGGSSVKLSDLDAFRKIIGDTDIDKLSKKQIRQFKSRGVAADDISNAMEELEAKERELAANRDALRLAQDKVRQMEEVVKVRLAKELEEGKGHTGGLITKGGAILAQKGEVLIDDILVQNLNNAAHVLAELQRTHSLSRGGAPIIIQDNSQKQVNQSQPVIIPPPSIQPGNADSPKLLA